ncbi:MAG: thioesterase family protein [bacterium]|nr:thioesterase family protein [bacterium]
MGDFECDTRLTPVSGTQGHYRTVLSEDWNIWGPNGGYLAGIALRAVGLEAKVPRPASFHGHFLSVARFEEVDVTVAPVRLGRRSESFQVSMTQKGKPILEGLVRTAALGPGLEHNVAVMPDVPAPEGLRNVETLLADFGREDESKHAFWNNIERRPIDPERLRGEWKAGPPVDRNWYRFRPRDRFDDPFLEAGRALLLLDTLTWPAACQPHVPDPAFIAPNLDVTAWFHAAAADEPWLLGDIESSVASDGLMGTTGKVWSRTGRLLATGGAQLFCVPAPVA